MLRIFSLLPPVHVLQLLLNLVHEMLSLSISHPDLVKFHYFVDTTEKRGLGMKGEKGEDGGDFIDNVDPFDCILDCIV